VSLFSFFLFLLFFLIVFSFYLLCSFKNLDLRWSTMPESVQMKLKQALLSTGSRMNIIDLSTFISSAREIYFRWYEDPELRKMVFENVRRCLSDKDGMKKAGRQPIVNILEFFGEMKLKWVDLPEELRTTIQNVLSGFSNNFSKSDLQVLSTA
jgi:hypothetical protein